MRLRPHHIFFVLMGLSVLSAFVLPSRYADHAPQIAALFAPISRPTGALAEFLHERFVPEPVSDQRSTDTIRSENRELKAEVQRLSIQMEELRARDAERGKLGTLRDLCTPIAVAGYDAGARESLQLRGSTFEGLRDGQAVVHPGGLLGSVARAGIAGAQVRLITDTGFRVRGSIGSFHRRADDSIAFSKLVVPVALFEGIGFNQMRSQNLTFEQVNKANVAVGDQVVLTDSDWSQAMQGQPLGRIVDISPRPQAPLFARITIEPLVNPLRLGEVMVVTKDK